MHHARGKVYGSRRMEFWLHVIPLLLSGSSLVCDGPSVFHLLGLLF